LHCHYIKFLRQKERDRMEAMQRRKEEIFRRQEEHALNLRLQRERDRMIGLQLKR
jgi:hypothetical protein